MAAPINSDPIYFADELGRALIAAAVFGDSTNTVTVAADIGRQSRSVIESALVMLAQFTAARMADVAIARGVTVQQLAAFLCTEQADAYERK